MKQTMKELAKQDRPYEKCLEFGPAVLTDAELLSVIIRTGTRGEKAIDLSNKILYHSESNKGLLGIMHLSTHELMQLKGIGKVKAIQIGCVVELSKRIAKATARESLKLTSPSSVADYFMEDMRHEKREQLILLLMNGKNKLLHETILSKGTVNASLVSPREIFVEALRYQAVSVMLIHNHPSGDPTPSKEDILVTRRVKEAGNLIGISLIDHIIIGDNRYVSLKERGIL